MHLFPGEAKNFIFKNEKRFNIGKRRANSATGEKTEGGERGKNESRGPVNQNEMEISRKSCLRCLNYLFLLICLTGLLKRQKPSELT